MVIFNKEFATVTIHRDLSLLDVKWLRQPTDEEFKEAFTFSMDTALKEEVKFFLSDNSAGINLALSMQHWVSTYAGNYTKRVKLERYARVVPTDAFQEVVSYKVYEYIKQLDHGDIEFRVFYNKEEALKWLLHGEQLSV